MNGGWRLFAVLHPIPTFRVKTCRLSKLLVTWVRTYSKLRLSPSLWSKGCNQAIAIFLVMLEFMVENFSKARPALAGGDESPRFDRAELAKFLRRPRFPF